MITSPCRLRASSSGLHHICASWGQHGVWAAWPAREPEAITALWSSRARLCSLVSRFTPGSNQAMTPCPLHKGPQGLRRRAAHVVVSYLQERGLA